MSNTEQIISTVQTPTFTHRRRTSTDPTKCLFVAQIMAIRQAEASGQRREAEALKNKLINASRGFIRKMSCRYYGSDVDQEDVDATAMLAFWRAVTTWQPDGGSPFDTWARWGMRMELQKMVRASRMIRGQKQERVSLASLEGDDIDETTMLCGCCDATPPSDYQGGTATVAKDGRQI